MTRIELCQGDQIGEVMTFIGRHWKANHVLATSRPLMDWQHRRADGAFNYLCAWEDSRLVGVLGFIPSGRFGGNEAGLTWLALWKVLDDVRSPVIGLKLLRELERISAGSGTAVLGINRTHPPMYKALGYRVGSLSHHFVVNSESEQPTLASDVSGLPVPKAGRAVLLELSSKELDDYPEIGVDSANPKSGAYFKSRFSEHPFYSYEIFGLSLAGQVRGLLATRLIVSPTGPVLRVVDYSGDPNVLSESGSAIAKLMASHSAQYADFLEDGIAAGCLASAGFHLTSAHPDLIVPMYFEPFERRAASIGFAVKARTDAPLVITKADGDQDRPNQLDKV